MQLTNPKTGQEINPPFESHQAAALALATKIADRVAKGGSNPSEFENSMLGTVKSQRGPSLGQAFWLHKLAMPEQKKEAIEIRDLAPIHAMLAGAAEKKRKPAITFSNVKLEWSMSSRYQRKVMVSQAGFGTPWYGFIDESGKLFPGRVDLPEDIRAFLIEFAKNPAETAAAYGKDSCHCCFCNLELTKDDSKAVGYGPVCAEKHGLPWGLPKVSKRRRAKRAIA